ncbi:PEP-CTERM sorting domain-containing protein [Roseofilum capinflatum]|uniref:PEP-CTERM sorting domain-containing protein n=1 Tax=Roseofilum capinflatum BLCC-M114 TaxID=3022440 RepID=A0ABT7B4N5_9CYAN|nr:PEP-CTERM sorting domain-containing protein [Roseofilum capinflatum]MDJ1174138.1 PEP-CTERM sorting domain-containing protein [Roseofilum capinflatum BLCC-M114]
MNKSLSLVVLATLGSVLGWTNAAPAASLIDFETLPNGELPTDNHPLGLDEAYLIDGIGITFGFDTNGDGVTDTPVVLEKVGNDTVRGFGSQAGWDTAIPGFEEQLGQFFVRQPSTINDFNSLIINYSSPVTAASGEIWDIDGWLNNTEQYKIEAFDSNREVLATIVSPLGVNIAGGLDGKPWSFGFSDLSDIRQISISFTGTKKGYFGLAFNNFSPTIDQTAPPPTSVPEPLAVLGTLLGTTFGIVTLKKKQFS